MLSYSQAKQQIERLWDHERIPGAFSSSQAGGKVPVFSLESLSKILARLGNPHHHLTSLHVAGSKGKGSTCAMIAQVLSEAGYRVGLYTSPHLYDLRERIRWVGRASSPGVVFGDEIGEDEFAWCFSRLAPVLADFPGVTFFEAMTAVAFLYFEHVGMDFVVLETGLGGRLDATNVCAACVNVLTPMDLEHTAVLGTSLSAIAGEKAAIIKPTSRAVVVAPQEASAARVIENRCRRVGVRAAWVGGEIGFQRRGDRLTVTVGGRVYDGIILSLSGSCQAVNAACAVAAVDALRNLGLVDIDETIVRRGLASVFWPGRGEILGGGPCVVLDVAHTRRSLEILVEDVGQRFGGRKIVLIAGFSDDKDIKDLLPVLGRLTSRVLVTQARHPRAARVSVGDLKQWLPSFNVDRCVSVEEAVCMAWREVGKEGVIVITGSVFVVSEARRLCQELAR